MFYTVYQITNLLDGKIYIGKHQTKNLDDGYMGSGKRLRYAMKKYGAENFKKEILFVFETELEMNTKEAELVNEEFVGRDDTYNICFGGQGGWSYINNEILDKEARISAGRLGGIAFGKSYRLKNPKHPKAMGPGKGCHLKGTDSPVFGKIWITNEIENRKIYPHESIPEGWRIGGRIKEVRKSDLKKELRLQNENEINAKFENLWHEIIKENISLCQAEKKFGITKQILMRRFRNMFPVEYATRFARKRTDLPRRITAAPTAALDKPSRPSSWRC